MKNVTFTFFGFFLFVVDALYSMLIYMVMAPISAILSLVLFKRKKIKRQFRLLLLAPWIGFARVLAELLIWTGPDYERRVMLLDQYPWLMLKPEPKWRYIGWSFSVTVWVLVIGLIFFIIRGL